jgi:hypothetical protein
MYCLTDTGCSPADAKPAISPSHLLPWLLILRLLLLQDAAEYLTHLLQLINRNEHAAAARLGLGEQQVRGPHR